MLVVVVSTDVVLVVDSGDVVLVVDSAAVVLVVDGGAVVLVVAMPHPAWHAVKASKHACRALPAASVQEAMQSLRSRPVGQLAMQLVLAPATAC